MPCRRQLRLIPRAGLTRRLHTSAPDDLAGRADPAFAHIGAGRSRGQSGPGVCTHRRRTISLAGLTRRLPTHCMQKYDDTPCLADTFLKTRKEPEMYISLSTGMISIPVLVWALYIGLAIGLIFGYYMKRILGEAVRRIIDCGAIGFENAKTLEELGINKPNIIHSIKKGALSKYIRSTRSASSSSEASETAAASPDISKEGGSPENKADKHTTTATCDEKFFISEEDRIQAELRYSKSGNDLFPVIISLIVFLMIAFIAARYLPIAIELIAGSFS